MGRSRSHQICRVLGGLQRYLQPTGENNEQYQILEVLEVVGKIFGRIFDTWRDFHDGSRRL